MSRDCNDLYYNKQVYWWSNYITDEGKLNCYWSKPASITSSGNHKQEAEKFAMSGLIFTDELSTSTPDDGIRIMPHDAGVSFQASQQPGHVFIFRAQLCQWKTCTVQAIQWESPGTKIQAGTWTTNLRSTLVIRDPLRGAPLYGASSLWRRS